MADTTRASESAPAPRLWRWPAARELQDLTIRLHALGFDGTISDASDLLRGSPARAHVLQWLIECIDSTLADEHAADDLARAEPITVALHRKLCLLGLLRVDQLDMAQGRADPEEQLEFLHTVADMAELARLDSLGPLVQQDNVLLAALCSDNIPAMFSEECRLLPADFPTDIPEVDSVQRRPGELEAARVVIDSKIAHLQRQLQQLTKHAPDREAATSSKSLDDRVLSETLSVSLRTLSQQTDDFLRTFASAWAPVLDGPCYDAPLAGLGPAARRLNSTVKTLQQSLSQISALREGFAALTERAPSQVDDLQAQEMDGISPADAEHMQGFVEAVRRRQEANQL